jgi:hypothetical protein
LAKVFLVKTFKIIGLNAGCVATWHCFLNVKPLNSCNKQNL